MLNKIATSTVVLFALGAMPAFADTSAPIPRCQVYAMDIGMGLERAGLPVQTTCSSTPTKNEAEFEFSLTLTDGRDAKMTCDPIRCGVPVIVNNASTQ